MSNLPELPGNPSDYIDTSAFLSSRLASQISALRDEHTMLARETYLREQEKHAALLSMAENSEQTAQDVSELNETVSGIDNRLALLNQRIEELERKYETEKNRADEAEKKNRASDQRFSLWLTILSIIMPFAFTLLLIWLGVKLQ